MMYFIFWNYCSAIEHLILCYLFDTERPIWYFWIVCDVTCDTLVTPLQLSQNMLRQFQVTGYADLAHVYDRVTKTETENEIILAKSDIKFLLSKTVLWQR